MKTFYPICDRLFIEAHLKTKSTYLSYGKVQAVAPRLSPSGRGDTLPVRTLEGSN